MSSRQKGRANGIQNRLDPLDGPAHDWYRFVLSFPPHLVAEFVERLDFQPGHVVLDPFCGTGTTLVECKKLGIASCGIEANPMAHFAGRVKLDWTPDPDGLLSYARGVAAAALHDLEADGIEDDPALVQPVTVPLRTLPDEEMAIVLTGSISPLPLHKVLILRDHIRQARDSRYQDHALLALARELTTSIGNLHFGPEVGVTAPKTDAPVVALWMAQIKRMADHLRHLGRLSGAQATIHCADARNVAQIIEPQSIDAVLTSPPYPNEKDYTRTTRLESVVLGFLHNKADLRSMKQSLLRSNTRNVYAADDDDRYISENVEIQRLAGTIEARRIELNKTSGFERLYGRTTKLYFGGMARHLAMLRTVLRPGARLGYVVGDQASYLRIMIRTGQLLADIARGLGYEVVSIDLFRTRLATATKEQLREEVVRLRWPG